MEEIWKDIPDYEGIYQVSNYGNVKTLKRTVKSSVGYRVIRERLLRPHLCAGYKTVALRKNNQARTTLIHILVAKCFIANPDNKRTVNHKDGIKTNSHVDNLEWATHSENNAHAYRTGLKMPVGLGKKGKECKNSILIYQYTLDNKFIGEYYGCHEASRITGIEKANIWACCVGRRNHAGGYIWKRSA